MMMMMMMMSGFVESVIRRAADQPNRWAFRCRANARWERVAVRRAAGKLFQMTGPATAKLLIPDAPTALVLLSQAESHSCKGGLWLVNNNRCAVTTDSGKESSCIYSAFLRKTSIPDNSFFSTRLSDWLGKSLKLAICDKWYIKY